MTTLAQTLLGHLNEIEEYFDNRADVEDGSYGIPEANKEMRLLQETRDAIRLIEQLAGDIAQAQRNSAVC